MEWNATFSTSETTRPATPVVDNLPQRLYQYIICMWLGLIGGATGTALAISVAIIVQSLQPPTAVFWPRLIVIAPVAAILGWGVSWGLGKLAYRNIPSFVNNKSGEHGLQVMLVVSGLLSVLQTYLFMAVL